MKISKFSARKDSLYLAAANSIYALSQWFLLLAIVKFTNEASVGIFSLGLAIVAPVIMLSNLQLRAIQATDSATGPAFSSYLAIRLTMSVLAIIATMALIFFGGYENHRTEITLILLNKILESFIDLAHGRLQKNNDIALIAKSITIRSMVNIVFFVTSLFFYSNLEFSLVLLNISTFIVLIFVDCNSVRKIGVTGVKITISKVKQIKAIIRSGIPLGVVMMLVSLNSNIPKYYIENQLGTSALGIYSALIYLVLIGGVLTNSIGQTVLAPMAISLSENNKARFKEIFMKYLVICILIGMMGVVAACFIGQEVVSILYGREYAENKNIIIFTALYGLISYTASAFGYALSAARVFTNQLLVIIPATAACLMLGLFLIPRYGLSGALIAMCMVSALQLTLSTITLYRKINEKEYS